MESEESDSASPRICSRKQWGPTHLILIDAFLARKGFWVSYGQLWAD